MLLIICTKYGKNPSWTVDATGRTRKVNRQTDRRTDRQTGWIQYTPPNFVAGGVKKITLKLEQLERLHSQDTSPPFSNLACDWLSIVWAYSEQETEDRSRSLMLCRAILWKLLSIQAQISKWTLGWPATHFIKCHLPLDKMAAILTYDIFKWILLNENDKIQVLNFTEINFTEICSQ